jgi:hypothetical protein
MGWLKARGLKAVPENDWKFYGALSVLTMCIVAAYSFAALSLLTWPPPKFGGLVIGSAA